MKTKFNHLNVCAECKTLSFMKAKITLALKFTITGVLFFTSCVALCQPPTIFSFTPASGPVGTIVTITGANFSATPTNNIVFFGATQASVTAATSTTLTVKVPIGATYQPITVLTNGLVAYSKLPFVVTFSNASDINGTFSLRADFATENFPSSVISMATAEPILLYVVQEK